MLVHSVERDHSSWFREDEPGQQILKSKTSYFVDDKKVSKIESQKVTGINRHSRKRWYRWQNQTCHTVFLTKDGGVAGRTKMTNRWTAGISFDTILRDPLMSENIEKVIGRPLDFNSVYPIASHYGIVNEAYFPHGFAPFMRKNSLYEFTVAVFGKARYRKDLAKAVAKATLPAVAVARCFRGLVPIDWIVNFLRINEQPNLKINFRVKDIRPVLRQIDPRSYRNLLRETLGVRGVHLINDILAVQTAPGRYNTFNEIHDAAYVARRNAYRVGFELVNDKYQPASPKEIPQTDLAKALDGIAVNGYDVRTAKVSTDLITWGNEMRNCIGSYLYQVTREDADTVLGAVYSGLDLVANFEIKGKELKQLLGKYNNNLEDPIRKPLENAFRDKGIRVGQYWGSNNIF